ncbi:MAG: DUF512 domain-containing protein [Oscillospiraceae bacterium]|nr:DUF512 domain-containing protein [Oscillospiraceae bacterium]
MSVLIKNVIPGSPADNVGIKAGTKLVSIDGNPINDVLDYMFYADDDMGLEFDTFLMSPKRSCGNGCVFCFIDQLPKGMRSSLYFKDDDSRLSFLQGNYITLTNLTQKDAERIVQMRTPVNISVHSVNPDLRAKLMGNKKAGDSLKTLKRFAKAGISMNLQLVLCPGLNDKEELTRSLKTLTALNERGNIESIACVPVGLTKFRDGLFPLTAFGKDEAADVIKIIGGFNGVYASDEFYLTAGIPLPEYEHYGAFPQYENGVGMWAHLKHGYMAVDSGQLTIDSGQLTVDSCGMRKISIVTGVLAYPLIKSLVARHPNVNVFSVRNDFFGEGVTVSGLLTGTDIIQQLLPQKHLLGEELLIGANTLNADKLFLDDVTIAEVEEKLGVRVKIVEPDGKALFAACFE